MKVIRPRRAIRNLVCLREYIEKDSERSATPIASRLLETINPLQVHPEKRGLETFLRSLEFYGVTWDVAQLAGDLFRQWRRKGQTLGLADVTIAAVALTHQLVLVTDNRKHFPMPELQILSLPSPREIE